MRTAEGDARSLYGMRCADLYGLVIGAGGALHGARIVCDAMRCARAGCIRAVRCDAREMRGPMRCELVAMQCAVQTGWWHSRGAGGTMLLTEGF